MPFRLDHVRIKENYKLGTVVYKAAGWLDPESAGASRRILLVETRPPGKDKKRPNLKLTEAELLQRAADTMEASRTDFTDPPSRNIFSVASASKNSMAGM